MTDVVILAGGYGTRLHGTWNGPKCLVPVGIDKAPILAYLLYKIHQECNVGSTFLLLGHQGQQVLEWFWKHWHLPCQLDVVIEAAPSGTANSLRRAIPALAGSALVMNGDTIPEYDLNRVLQQHQKNNPALTTAWTTDQYAGAAVFSQTTLRYIASDSNKDLDHYIYTNTLDNLRLRVRDFLDVGTPENFERAKTWLPRN